ncbi:YkgJ family cysteine cluster protein [Geomonas sp.]|uniref:YkgJ family cysteine cluster protein n=1 Tax=Geomonas sp. TaxID=2651584 RepID=UPI002B4783E6|nr:YkgJ family cysteine cluster protein [Geomonas sp.]HJV35833.1 YkgJ family cysteine cluster protein [Geomonas sp.]
MLFIRHEKKRHGILLDHPVDDPTCCRECDGVCCRSFPTVELTWDEYRDLESLGATRLQFSLYGPHKLIIENGCEFLQGSRCGIYEHRPAICRRFVCQPEGEG